MPLSSLPTHRTPGPITCMVAVTARAASKTRHRALPLHRAQHRHDAARARRPLANLPLQAGICPDDDALAGASTVRRCSSGLRGISSSTSLTAHGHAP